MAALFGPQEPIREVVQRAIDKNVRATETVTIIKGESGHEQQPNPRQRWRLPPQ